jgi:nitric oxide reductase subunit B
MSGCPEAATRDVDPTRSFATLTFIRGALIAVVVTLLAGFLSVLHHVPATGELLRSMGLEFTALRPIHTTFASAWIFLAGIAVVHRYLEDHGGPVTAFERWRLRLQVLLWAGAGLGILITLPMGITSGREYMGFHPALSIPILLGWLLFAWNFFGATWRGFWTRPVYVTMWGVGALFFVFTFLEQHAWMLPEVFERPVVDMRIQWKSCGTLVGSFNLFVYGSLIYAGEKLTGDSCYGCSRLAYGLLGVGLLNSFTNFAHHTYHLPQSEVVKWIAFVVSMIEIIILARVIWDVAKAVGVKTLEGFDAPRFFFKAAKIWTLVMLVVSILISVPSLNSLIHGTPVVIAHAMGTEIGIDSMVLFGALAWILMERLGAAAVSSKLARIGAKGFNHGTALLVSWLMISGLIVGVTRYEGTGLPAWLANYGPYAFAGAGALTGLFLALLLIAWLPLVLRHSPETVASEPNT